MRRERGKKEEAGKLWENEDIKGGGGSGRVSGPRFFFDTNWLWSPEPVLRMGSVISGLTVNILDSGPKISQDFFHSLHISFNISQNYKVHQENTKHLFAIFVASCFIFCLILFFFFYLIKWKTYHM